VEDRSEGEMMVRPKSKTLFWIAVIGFLFAIFSALSQRADAQDESAIDVLRDSQENRFLETDDDQQNWMVFWLCREMDNLRETIAENEDARREDDKELRSQIWKLALIVGGGGAIGGAGGVAAAKRKKK